MSSNWAGVVLAGGASSRMGQDKALLQLGGATLLQRALAQLERAGCQPFAVTRDGGAGSLRDRPGVAGPLAGIAGAVDLLRPFEVLLLLPVDMPLLPDGALRQLRGALSDECPYLGFANSLFPLALRNDQQLTETLNQLVNGEPRQASIQGLLQALGAVLLPVAEQWQARFSNCNTPAQWETIVASYQRESEPR